MKKMRCKRTIAAVVLMLFTLTMFSACSGRSYVKSDTSTIGQLYEIKGNSAKDVEVIKPMGEKIVEVDAPSDTNPSGNSTTNPDDSNNTTEPDVNNPDKDSNSPNNDVNTPNPDDDNSNSDDYDDRDYSTSCMSFNILAYDTHYVGYAEPSVRIDYIIKTVQKYDPDLVGMQEVMAAASQNGNYDTYGTLVKSLGGTYSSRALIQEKGSTLSALTIGSGEVIFYRTNRFELKDSGAAVYTNDAGRHYQWVKLYDTQEKVTIIMTNTHFSINPDNTTQAGIAAGVQKRARQAAELYAFWLKNAKDTLPLYATGDYNHRTSEQAYTVLSQGDYKSSRDVAQNSNADSSIDFVYINFSVQDCYKYTCIKDSFEPAGVTVVDNNYKYRASDHWAIIAYCSNT